MAKFTKTKKRTVKSSKRASAKAVRPVKASRKPTKSSQKPIKPAAKAQKSSVAKPLVERSLSNPYRIGSSYGHIYDCIASTDGISRPDLLQMAMKFGKDARHAGYDLNVVLSPRESPTSSRHRSARDGYWLEEDAAGLLHLRTAPPTTGK
jgi:hypothetical protein